MREAYTMVTVIASKQAKLTIIRMETGSIKRIENDTTVRIEGEGTINMESDSTIWDGE